MRPIELELRGFTAFRDEQVISFDGLDLFAVTGETGAGKSSILDAMTYALFGDVPRLHGARGSVSSCIALGQPRMTVRLDFEAGAERWRVTRSTPLNGPSKIAFERWSGADWISAGEGSDRVKQATQMIAGVIGLDFRAFTRSVLLPQGQFQEFLVGDASERRTILTELLGLELFGRLAKRAGGMASSAKAQAEAKSDLYDKEYAGITPEAIEEARAAAEAGRSADAALAEAEAAATSIAAEARGAIEATKALTTLVEEASVLEERVTALAAEASEAADAAEVARGAVTAAAKAVTSTAKALGAATKAQAAAAKRWGSATELATMLTRAERLAEDHASLAKDAEAVEKHAEKLGGIQAQAEKASAASVAATAALAEAMAAATAAEVGVEEARHGDLVATVSSGLMKGDPCPVCGEPLPKAPPKSAGTALAKAERALAAVVKKQGTADVAQRKAERRRDEAERAVVDFMERRDEARAGVAARRTALAETEASFAAVAKEGDPVPVLQTRIDELDRLTHEMEAAHQAATDAEKSAADAERATERHDAAVATLLVRFEGLRLGGLWDRAAAVVSAEPVAEPVVSEPATPDAPGLVAAATAAQDSLRTLREGLGRAQGDASQRERSFVERAVAAAAPVLGDRFDAQSTVDDCVALLAQARREAAAQIARAESKAEEMAKRAEAGATLLAEVAAIKERAAVLGSLAKELRADKIVSFLQHEALVVLAVRASDHLLRMSDGGYQLTYDPVRDEFWVIDMANGEEERPARTLSGGETFLASLALALALSEGVQALAVEARPPLDSLFLDEGFGTLDPETLETVVQAIEHLGGDGRMVGVITHVRELALRLPARIEVTKGDRGSRALVVAGSIEE